MGLSYFWLLLVFAFSPQAWSIVEIKMTYSGLYSDPKASKIYNGNLDFPTPSPSYGLGADVVLDLPVGGLGIGMRYENLGLKFSGHGIKVESEMSRTALLLSWRLIDDLIYLGPTLTYGVSHSGGTISVLESGNTIANLEVDQQTSYSAGVELGVKLLGFRVGAEAGYMLYDWKDLSGTSGSIQNVGKLDMSGTYAKIILGFGI